jgi:Putative transposase
VAWPTIERMPLLGPVAESAVNAASAIPPMVPVRSERIWDKFLTERISAVFAGVPSRRRRWRQTVHRRRPRGRSAGVLRRDRGSASPGGIRRAPLRRKKWFVYAKPPFAGPEAVLAYLARYTHRVAIANSRLVSLNERGVSFRYKDYRRNGQARFRTMTLEPNEFIRRFLLHVLPKGFHRIRHYGLLASATCKANIARARELIATPPPSIEPSTEQDAPGMTAGPRADYRPLCPCCGGRMIILESFGPGGGPRAPPSPQAGVGTAMP